MPTKTLQPNLQNSTIFTLIFFLHSHAVKSHIFIYAGCSQEKYQPNTPFEPNLNTFLSSVVNSAAESTFNSFAIGNTTPDSAIYGLYQCRGDLKPPTCLKCIENSINQISLLCPYSYGASLQLDACYLRYEHVDFLGKLDTSLRFKKCSKHVSNDVEFFRRRDDVLADLQTALGFKVSSSGLVEGFAQCLGDVSSADCSACLADAVLKLKSLCGSASAADVFLAQCYARYWASGYYDFSSDSSKEDQVGKTVAIIVGCVAGLAIFIVLLSFCRKAMG